MKIKIDWHWWSGATVGVCCAVAVMAFGIVSARAIRWAVTPEPINVAAERQGEVEIVAGLAEKYFGKAEVVMPDRTRCDLLTDVYAIEADWAHKWAEGVGQCVHYALLTGKAPGLILLTRDRAKDSTHIARATRVCKRLRIQLFVEDILL